MITNKVLLYGSGIYIHYFITYKGKYFEKNIFITESFGCTPETNNTVNQLYFSLKKMLSSRWVIFILLSFYLSFASLQLGTYFYFF